MNYTRLTNLEVTGEIKGVVASPLKGVAISKSANYTLADNEKAAYIGVTYTAASKTLTLDLPDGAVSLVVNEGGSNAFTLKNVSGDSGTSVAAGKAYLVRASQTANGSVLTLLNNYTA